MKKSPVDKLLKTHRELTHTQDVKVVSHIQRHHDDWYINTIIVANIDVPFKFKRKKLYKTLTGAHVNITYYPATESIAGFSVEVMNIVRIKLA
jgi:hypothetical protein